MEETSSDEELPLPKKSTKSTHVESSATFRKRSRGSRASNNSSDPPCFSSDDLADASVDNYVSPRRKKQYRRTWWEEEGATPIRHKALKRASQRAKDSGVFMSSDSSSNSSDGFSIEDINRKGRQLPTPSFLAAPTASLGTPIKKNIFSGEDVARSRISQCLEEDREVVDLSNLHLIFLSGETIKPLENLISRPKVYSSQVEDLFDSLKPQIELYISSNQLTKLPNELVNLTNLRVLSLRNNMLQELPHSIGKLENLVELNLASNNLRWLPYELLSLSRAHRVHNLNLLPNPFLEPFPSILGEWMAQPTIERASLALEQMKSALEEMDTGIPRDPAVTRSIWLYRIQEVLYARMLRFARANEADRDNALFSNDRRIRYSAHYPWKCQPIYLGSTNVTYFDFDGTVPRSAHPAPSRLAPDTRAAPVAQHPKIRHPVDCKAPMKGSVPSLFELALRSASENLAFQTLDKCLDYDTPEAVVKGLELARAASEQGDTLCSVCDKMFILPRAEWIEYWHCAPDSLQLSYQELFLPFLRRTCSWGCADRILTEGDSLMLRTDRFQDGSSAELSILPDGKVADHHKYWSH